MRPGRCAAAWKQSAELCRRSVGFAPDTRSSKGMAEKDPSKGKGSKEAAEKEEAADLKSSLWEDEEFKER